MRLIDPRVPRLLILALLLSLFTPLSAEEDPASGSTNFLSLEDDSIRSVRLEVFAAGSSEPLFDTGILRGNVIPLPTEPLTAEPLAADAGRLKFEVRAWDASGDLVLSQVSTVRGVDAISSISFESIPPDVSLVGTGPISLQADTEVLGGLSVSGAVEANTVQASQLQNSGGTSFFDACPPNTSIRVIAADGSVTCDPDNSGGNDDLGNHTATQNLILGSHTVDFNAQWGLRASGGGELKTGVNGETFQLFAGGPTADAARFWTSGSNLIFSVNPDGLNFNGGQKVCSCYGTNGRSSLLVSSSWTAATCNAYKDAVCPNGSYQLFCVFANTFTFGVANGGIPSPTNCGW